MTFVKTGYVRRPAMVATAAAALFALLAMNVAAFTRGLQPPGLLSGLIAADLMVIGVGVMVMVRQALAARRRIVTSEARLDAIVDSAMDAIITVDEEQNIVLFNRAAEQVFGVKRETMLGAPLDSVLPARFRGVHRGHIEGFGRTGVTSRRMGDITALWALRPETGEEFPIEASISQALEGDKRYYTVILRDITRRKQSEDALRQSQRELRELSAQVLEAREDEKARIARELHDELGQLLGALKMDLSWLRKRLPNDPELTERAEEMGQLLERTVSSTRRIASDLRPLILDDLGLAEAATGLAEDFGKRSGIACRIEIENEAKLENLSKAVAVTGYRAIQESLTNVARHAGARNVWIAVAVRDAALEIEIEDDGSGIAPEDLAKPGSLGLKGMRERISFVGGSLDIARPPRGGTRVRLRVPVHGLAQERSA